MTQEEKELFLRDLCARLPYGVKYQDRIDKEVLTLTLGIIHHYERFIPYLRPMSSMTLEEECEFCRLFECDSVNAMYGYINWVTGGSCDYYDFDIEFSKLAKIMDWLNTHHFDYRGLIEKGLALEAPEGMYKID